MKKTILAAGAALIAVSGVAIAAQPGGGWNADMSAADADARAEAMFERMDVNDDGQIDAADREARTAQKFARMDTDGDGSLSLEEFSTRPERGERMGRHGGDRMGGHHGKRGGMRMMKMADTDGDGAVSKAEFTAAHQAHFAMMDADGDGTVTAEERKAMRDQMRASRRGANAN